MRATSYSTPAAQGANLGARRQTQARDTELAPLLTLVGAVLVLAAAALSYAWFGRVG